MAAATLTVMLALLAVMAIGVSSAAAAGPRLRVGTMTRLPRSALRLGSVPASRRLRVTIGLRSRNGAALDRLVRQVSDPRSPLFRHYISVGEFARRFGAAPDRIAAVRRAMRRAGLTVGPATANRLTIPASGTAAALERAFSARLERVALAGGRRAFANMAAPTLPASIAADVQTVAGLQDVVVPHPAHTVSMHARASGGAVHGHVVTGGPQPCSAATAVTSTYLSYTIDSIAAAYNFQSLYGAGDQGAGQTIALYELEPIDLNDVAAYQSCFGTATPFSVVNVDKGPTPISDGDEEAALDSEIILGLAPQAHVVIYQGPQSTGGLDVYSKIMSDDTAKVVSVSWVACEQYATAGGHGAVNMENKLFAEAAVQGQSILVGSGDQGSSGCAKDLGTTGLAVDDPASQPNATAVGGSSLYTVSSTGTPAAWSPGQTLTEGVWNSGRDPLGVPYASTGGLSAVWGMPSYQSSAAPGLGVLGPYSSGAGHVGGPPCHRTHCRQTPDVSADGNPDTGYVIYANGPDGHGWQVAGGTSAATPVWGALTTLANALPACRSLPIGFENPSLYALAGSDYAAYFRDVNAADPVTRQANNDAAGATGGLYPTTAGYDLTTGLGAPSAGALATGLCALRAPVYTVAVANPGTRNGFLRSTFRLAVRGSDSGGAALVYAAKGLPPGLRLKASTGVISGTPKKLGKYAVTVTAVDFAANGGQAAFTIHVRRPPPRFTRVALHGVARRRPQLSFTVTRARGSVKVRSVTIRLPRGLTFGRRGRGIHARAGRSRARFASRVRHGALTIRFRRLQSSVTMTIARPTLFASKGLARSARKHPKGKVRLGLNVTDSTRFTMRRTVSVRLKR